MAAAGRPSCRDVSPQSLTYKDRSLREVEVVTIARTGATIYIQVLPPDHTATPPPPFASLQIPHLMIWTRPTHQSMLLCTTASCGEEVMFPCRRASGAGSAAGEWRQSAGSGWSSGRPRRDRASSLPPLWAAMPPPPSCPCRSWPLRRPPSRASSQGCPSCGPERRHAGTLLASDVDRCLIHDQGHRRLGTCS